MRVCMRTPTSKSAPPKGACITKKSSFVRPFSKAQILGAFTTPSLVAACFPLAFGDCVRWRERLRVRLRVRLQVQLRSRPPWLKAAAAAAVATSATGQ
jgi:hypothetical protein